MQQLLRQVQLHIRARYPLLYLLTHEETRVWRALELLATEEHKALWRWRSTVGLQGPDGPIPATKNPLAALRYFSEIEEPALAVFWDLHSYLDEPGISRWIRDLCIEMGSRGQTLILISSKLNIPTELEKTVAIVDVPLPTYDEVSRLLHVLCEKQDIKIQEDLFERFVQGSLGLTEEEIKRLFSRILLGSNPFVESDLSMQIDEKKRAIRRSRFLEFWDTNELTLNVGGMDSLKSWLNQRSLAFTPKAKEFGLPDPKGLFLLGVQGCGKSLMAKTVAKLWKLPLLRLDVAAVFQSSSGVEIGLRDTIRVAESMAPVVLWIDELEKGFLRATGSGDGLGYFLTWMQEKKKPVFVVATANEVRSLPPELLRKGRFDEIFFVDLPDVHERLEIMDIHLRQRNRMPENFDLTMVIEESERFSGAELEQVVVSALYHAFSEDRDIETDDLLDSAREIIPLATTMDDRLKELREWARPRARRATADRRRVDFFSEWESI